MSELEAIRAEAQRRGINRLAHFTPMRNLVHIATGNGLLSTRELERERADFNPQDLERLDGFTNHISCGIEYPNSYYVRRKRKSARGEERLFPDWVCLLIEPHYLWHEDTLLCPHNAAGSCGAAVRGGLEWFKNMFADQIEAPQRTWVRDRHLKCCPTDAQAEVMVHRFIPLDDVQAIAVETTDQARNTYASLKQLGAPVERLPFVVAPAFYEPTGLAANLRRGQRPVESPWHPPTDGDGVHESDG